MALWVGMCGWAGQPRCDDVPVLVWEDMEDTEIVENINDTEDTKGLEDT